MKFELIYLMVLCLFVNNVTSLISSQEIIEGPNTYYINTKLVNRINLKKIFIKNKYFIEGQLDIS